MKNHLQFHHNVTKECLDKILSKCYVSSKQKFKCEMCQNEYNDKVSFFNNSLRIIQ